MLNNSTKHTKTRKGVSFIERTAVVDAYFNDIRSYSPLSDHEVRKLIKVVQKGRNYTECRRAMDKIVLSNQRLVVSIAKCWYRKDNLLDLVNEGNIGLIEAINHYKVNKPIKFSYYASLWIKAKIREYVAEKEKIVRPPNAVRLFTYCNTTRSLFFNKCGRNPTNEELSGIIHEKYNFDIADTSDLNIIEEYRYDSSESTINENDIPLSNIYTDYLSTNNDVEEKHVLENLHVDIDNRLSRLDCREKDIVLRYNGVGHYYAQTFDEIGEDYALSPQRVRQIYNRAIEKCRKD